ncbi:NAD-P-binding protein [Sparassis latifolia]
MIATALESNGAIVYIVSRNQENLDRAVREHSHRGNLIALQGDVTDRESLKAVTETIQARHGYVNLLINNAGIVRNVLPTPLPPPAPGATTDADGIVALQDLLWNAGTPEDFDTTFRVNTTAAFYCSVAFLRLLHAANLRTSTSQGGTSQVITISSGASFRKDGHTSVSYSLSKIAVTHLGKSLAHMLKDWNIRSNVIAPGLFPSDMTTNVTEETVKRMVPAGRMGDINDIGGLVLFLASKAGSYVNGVAHIIDGGRLTLFPSVY